MRFSYFCVIAFSFSYLAVALPITSPECRDSSSLSHVSRALAGELRLFERDVVESILLDKRANPKRRKIKKGGKAKGKNQPASPKVTFGNDAKRKLDELGLHGKDRKKAKKYHKAIVKAEMKGHGAAEGKVFHLAHKGGSDPNEKGRLTVGLYDKQKIKIKSPWAVKKETETGKATKGLFHMYPENHRFKEPKSFTTARDKLQARQKAAAEAAANAAEAKREAEEARKRAAINKQKEAAQSLSAEELIARRQARKEKKAAGKKPAGST